MAAAVAAEAAGMISENPGSKIDAALASATELLASHCVEMAEMAGARHEQVAEAVKSAVDARSVGDLMTLTAAAATGLYLKFESLLVLTQTSCPSRQLINHH